ncbi:MAG TPA: DUF1990 domain-containing protein [Jatrophihabitans sp.]|nr:DUF1990 domain-containing protein [Jatrophihabitans sp.]
MDARLERVLSAEPTFTGDAGGPCPPGFHRLRLERWAGTGDQVFERAAARVLSWQVLRQAGLRIDATAERPEPGTTVLQRLGPVQAPCRVATVVREPRRAGFSYLTLPGHAERGVEQFMVEHRDDNSVWCVVSSISRPEAWYARLGGPAGRLVQQLMVRRYLAAMAG